MLAILLPKRPPFVNELTVRAQVILHSKLHLNWPATDVPQHRLHSRDLEDECMTDRSLLFGRGGTLTQRRGCSRRNCTETWSEWTICPRRPLPASAGRGRRGMPSLVGRPPQRRRRRSGVETGLDWPARDATACRRRTTQRNAARPPPLVFLGLAFSPRPPPRAPAVADLAPGFAPTTRSAAGSFRSRPSGVAR